VPRRVLRHVAALRGLAEVPQQVRLDVRVLAAEPLEARREVRLARRLAAEREVGAVARELLVPRVGEHELVQVRPGFGADLVHPRAVPAVWIAYARPALPRERDPAPHRGRRGSSSWVCGSPPARAVSRGASSSWRSFSPPSPARRARLPRRAAPARSRR